MRQRPDGGPIAGRMRSAASAGDSVFVAIGEFACVTHRQAAMGRPGEMVCRLEGVLGAVEIPEQKQAHSHTYRMPVGDAFRCGTFGSASFSAFPRVVRSASIDHATQQGALMAQPLLRLFLQIERISASVSPLRRDGPSLGRPGSLPL